MKLLSNQRGEVIAVVFVSLAALLLGHAHIHNSKEQDKQRHYDTYHEEAQKKERALQEALEAADDYRI